MLTDQRISSGKCKSTSWVIYQGQNPEAQWFSDIWTLDGIANKQTSENRNLLDKRIAGIAFAVE